MTFLHQKNNSGVGQKFYDITRTLGLDEICYPGDSPFEAISASSIEKGDAYNLLRLKISNHLGTHLDAPRHFFANGPSLDSYTMDRFFMEALVVQIDSASEISEKQVAKFKLPSEGAVLFKTKNRFLSRNKFSENYIYLNEAAAEQLVKSQIGLVGIDYVSIEAFQNRSGSVHQLLLGANILILEDINLQDVPPGSYQLICLPIKINNSDGGPCRAVLLK